MHIEVMLTYSLSFNSLVILYFCLVPDVNLIRKSHHDIYYVSARDPLERFQSAFTSTHPLNRQYLRQRGNGIDRRRNRQAFKCFPTLEKFAEHLGSKDVNNTCSIAARAAANGENRVIVHMWGNYQKMAAPIPYGAKVFVVRTTHLWDDWFRINKLLDPTRDVYIPRNVHERNVKNLTLPVTRTVSEEGRMHLCEALEKEYRVFFELLERAGNLNATDLQEARSVAYKNCPNLVLSDS